MRRRSAVAGVVAVAALIVSLIVSPVALAAIDGPCEATLAGFDLRDREVGPRAHAISVHEATQPVLRMTSNRQFTSMKVEMKVTGFTWTVREEPVSGRSWETELPLDDYATWGIGLFEVIATGTGSGFSCEATTLIDVEGSSVATVAGLSGLALLVVGAVGVLVLIMRGGRAGGQPFAGVFFGALLGIGVGTLLQQFGVLYPTIPVSIVVVAAGALVGLLAGMIGFRPLEGAP